MLVEFIIWVVLVVLAISLIVGGIENIFRPENLATLLGGLILLWLGWQILKRASVNKY
jgi:threonine/homoserine/homoserine lactone efflux protein